MCAWVCVCMCASDASANGCTGPGAFDFKQGDTNGTLFWRVVGHFLHNPTESQISCQAPKPILLDTGNAHIPYEWYSTLFWDPFAQASDCVCCLPWPTLDWAHQPVWNMHVAVNGCLSSIAGLHVSHRIARLFDKNNVYLWTMHKSKYPH